jgi:O-antigen ligase
MAALALVGYAAAIDLRVSAALLGAIILAVAGLVAYRYPSASLSVSVMLILLTGTKFRRREATASLEGAIDAQIAFELGLFVLVGGALLAWWMAMGRHRRLSRLELLIGGYTGIALLSALWSEAPTLTLVRGVQLAIVAGLAVASVRTLGPSRALWTACAGVALYTVACTASGPTFPWVAEFADAEYRNRFAWFSVHPIAVGTTAAMATLGILSAVFWAPPTPWRRMLGLPLALYALPLAVILVATNSRGPLLACVAGAGVMVFLRCSVAVRVLLALTATAVLLLMFMAGRDVQALLATVETGDSAISQMLLQEQTLDDLLGLNGRLKLWTEASPMMIEHFWLGQGYQASRATMLAIADWAGYAHNALMQSVLDLGVVGTVALVALVIAGLWRAFTPSPDRWLQGTSAAPMVFLVLMSISMEMFAGAPAFETLLFFICVLVGGPSRSGVQEER